MFSHEEKSIALKFAHALANNDYSAAYEMCNVEIKTSVNIDLLQKEFETIIPDDWDIISPIELIENDDFPFVYIVLGGESYSEAIIINEFSLEKNEIKIASYEFGRP